MKSFNLSFRIGVDMQMQFNLNITLTTKPSHISFKYGNPTKKSDHIRPTHRRWNSSEACTLQEPFNVQLRPCKIPPTLKNHLESQSHLHGHHRRLVIHLIGSNRTFNNSFVLFYPCREHFILNLQFPSTSIPINLETYRRLLAA